MTKLSFDIEGLKKLAVLNINTQYFLQKQLENFARVFNYEGDRTSEYEDMCKEFETNINSLVVDIEEVKQLIVNRINISN